MTSAGSDLSALATESRRFDPPAELAARANVTADAYDDAWADRLGFWEEQARRLQWDKQWQSALVWERPFAKWFVGGELNVAVNCVDRHVEAGNGDRVALYWEGEPEGDRRVITYAELLVEVCRAANALVELGVKAGDRVMIYLRLMPPGTEVSTVGPTRTGVSGQRMRSGRSRPPESVRCRRFGIRTPVPMRRLCVSVRARAL